MTLTIQAVCHKQLQANLESREVVDIQLRSCQQAQQYQLHENTWQRPSFLVPSSLLFAALTTNLSPLQWT